MTNNIFTTITINTTTIIFTTVTITNVTANLFNATSNTTTTTVLPTLEVSVHVGVRANHLFVTFVSF